MTTVGVNLPENQDFTTFKIFNRVSNNRTYVKTSHFIDMSNIQIDTKSLELIQQHQIVLLFRPFETEFLHYVRLLDTHE